MEPIRPLPRASIGIAAAVCWFGLALQLYCTLALWSDMGRSPLSGLGRFFSYFTVLTNTLAALSLSWPLLAPATRLGRFFSRSSADGAVTTYMALVGITYHLLLASTWNPTGAQYVADLLLHTITPILYIALWLAIAPKGQIAWGEAGWWLLYPAAYFVFVVLTGPFTHFYPYPFLDVETLGYGRVLLNSVFVAVGFFALSAIVIALDRWLGRRQAVAPVA